MDGWEIALSNDRGKVIGVDSTGDAGLASVVLQHDQVIATSIDGLQQ